MKLSEIELIIDYFHQSTPEHLENLGVDPTRLPEPHRWRERYEFEYGQPIETRKTILIVWESDGEPFGFSTADKIVFGKEAYMHLHIIRPEQRANGVGAVCVEETVKIYFDVLKLERLFCEPNAYNTAPNRTLQKAGFKYLKTHKTVPNPLNFHQTVNRWVIERNTVN
jgi:RimJ/RimL family protein N-acetyltransferase